VEDLAKYGLLVSNSYPEHHFITVLQGLNDIDSASSHGYSAELDARSAMFTSQS
jgi:hypothetical protein